MTPGIWHRERKHRKINQRIAAVKRRRRQRKNGRVTS